MPSATITEAQQLLSTTYHIYRHDTGIRHVACEEYFIPSDVFQHLDLITPTIYFNRHHSKRRTGKIISTGLSPLKATSPRATPLVEQGTEDCDSTITPDCLRALYDMNYTPQATDQNSYGIVEYSPQAYLQSDLNRFYTNFSSSSIGLKPTLISIDGGYAQTIAKGYSFNAESDLDIEYAQTLVTGELPITLYQAGDLWEGASFNNLLDALDGSYWYEPVYTMERIDLNLLCSTAGGGDDPAYDGIYPDANGSDDDSGSYKGPESCGIAKPAYVISTSYLDNEADITPAYATRQCFEYAKLGLMGTTVIYASGDFGVAGNYEDCLYSNGTQGPDATRFNPSFPATCPYVTAIGGTQLPPGRSVNDINPEVAAYDSLRSGGGFSNYFTRPAYQKPQVAAFLEHNDPPYSSPLIYNSSGRAYPDISANGANYLVALDGSWALIGGTSASAPVIGAMITNINDARLAVGKPPVGFINPAIYSSRFREAYNDITNGSNSGCGTDGFNATKGWDPVTGLGTPRFPVLLDLFLHL
jgi:tripeptidyl-peptidase-1